MAVKTSSVPRIVDLIGGHRLRALYQPIVDLDTSRTVGFEALARGPAGSVLEMPVALFGAAIEEGVLSQLDRACREAALKGALTSGFPASQLLFLNVEPAGLDIGGMSDRLVAGELERVSVVVEMTERALTTRPSEVLGAVRWLRERNCRIALDDVGVDRRSLALMPFLAPDVIKLDMSLTQDRLPIRDAVRVLTAVGAEVERSGAVLLAEGIETEADLRRAQGMGATLGQGWYFGRPDALPESSPDQGSVSVPRRSPTSLSSETPFERIAGARRLRSADKRTLLMLSRQFEVEARDLGGEAVVISTFQDATYFSQATRALYERLAEDAAMVCAIGFEMSAAPARGVRGASLAA